MTNVKERLGDLSPDRIKALMAELNRRKASAASSTPVTRIRRSGRRSFPLSYEQERIWFAEQLLHGAAIYHWPFATIFEFAVDPALFERVLSMLAERHEILRTTYQLFEGRPMQVVSAPSRVALTAVDLTHDANAEQSALTALREDMLRPFDLERGPLFRFYLYQLPGTRSVFGGTFHHSIVDAWSRNVLVAEMAALSRQVMVPESPRLPELPVQYGDYAAWQRERNEDESAKKALAYWRQKLAGLSELDLPADRPRPSSPLPGGGTAKIELPALLTASLRSLAQTEGATMFMVLLAGFLAVLSRRSGNTDAACAIPVANRDRAEIEGLIGFFVNTLVVREQVTASRSFTELLRQVKTTLLEALAHQETPFERLVEELRPKRELGRNPFTQYMFQLEGNTGGAGQEAVNELDIDLGLSAFDIEIHLYDRGASGINGSLTYSAELFDQETIAGVIASYLSLLNGAAAAPNSPLNQLPVIAQREQAKLLRWSRQTPPGWTQETSLPPVHMQIAAAADRAPEALAVVCGEDRLVYGALEQRSSAIARLLQASGVGRGSLVAVCLDRSIELMPALLGVLKAGAAYVPLDPRHPADRLQSMLHEAQPAFVLTESKYSESHFAQWPRRAALDTFSPADVSGSASLTIPALCPDDLAYVIFTSGSTGRPKGVAVRHGALSNVIASFTETCGLTSRDILLALSSVSFDISALEFFLPLTIGATTVLAETGDVSDPERIADLMERHVVTVAQTTPATWQMLLTSGRRLGRGNLKILCGGEKLPPEVATRLGQISPEVWNVYGPTETTIWSSFDRLHPEAGPVSIGRPLANTAMYVLDASLDHLPIGVAGDLYIAGEGLARGYLNRPDLTADAFLPDPHGAQPGGRMYRTGDRARYRGDGSILFLGRLDSQVKLRGYRIELGEIEAWLLRHPSVSQAAVHLSESGAGNAHLVAHYQLRHPEDSVTRADLRSYLLGKLPEYMVPATFLRLDIWPLTVNAKLDRKALQLSGQLELEAAVFEAPEGQVEVSLAALWAHLLKRPRIGRHDNFFEQGGDSLASVQLVYLAKEQGMRLRPSDVFEHQSLSELARAVEAAAAGDATGGPLVTLKAAGSGSPLFLVHPAGGDVMCYHSLAQLVRDRPVVGLTYRGYPGFGSGAVSIEGMASWYLDALVSAWPQGPYTLGGWSYGALIAFEMARQLSARGIEVEALLLIDQPAPPRSLKRKDKQPVEASSVFSIALKIESASGVALGLSAADLEAFTEEAQLDLLVDRMKSTGLAPAHLVSSAMRDFVRAYDEHAQAAAAYRASPYAGAATLFRAVDPAYRETLPHIDAEDDTMGWRELCGKVDVVRVAGNHLTVVAPTHAYALATHIQDRLQPRKETL